MHLFLPKYNYRAPDWLRSWHMEINVSKHWRTRWVTDTSSTPLPVWLLCNNLGSLDSRLLSCAARRGAELNQRRWTGGQDRGTLPFSSWHHFLSCADTCERKLPNTSSRGDEGGEGGEDPKLFQWSHSWQRIISLWLVSFQAETSSQIKNNQTAVYSKETLSTTTRVQVEVRSTEMFGKHRVHHTSSRGSWSESAGRVQLQLGVAMVTLTAEFTQSKTRIQLRGAAQTPAYNSKAVNCCCLSFVRRLKGWAGKWMWKK